MIIDILEEHLEEADFLLQQRENALSDRVYDLQGLAELEERLLAHLDGLLVGEKEAWKLLEPKLADGEFGEVFAAAFVALESKDSARIELVRKVFPEAEGAVMNGIRHALRHAPALDIDKVVRPQLGHKKGAVRAAAIDVLSFRRILLEKHYLRSSLNEDDPLVVVAALNAVARLRLSDLNAEVNTALGNHSAQIRAEAMRAGVLMKNEKVLNRCRKAVLEGAEEAGSAMILIGLAGDPSDAALIVHGLEEADLARHAVIALGLLGSVAAMEPLIARCSDPGLSRLAGDAIRTLSGIDLEKERLTAPKTVSPQAAEPDREDDLETDPDEGLSHPDPEKIASWWKANAPRFDRNVRYRLGHPHGPQILLDRLRNGALPERHGAAFEWAMMNPANSFLETHAFAELQRRTITGLN